MRSLMHFLLILQVLPLLCADDQEMEQALCNDYEDLPDLPLPIPEHLERLKDGVCLDDPVTACIYSCPDGKDTIGEGGPFDPDDIICMLDSLRVAPVIKEGDDVAFRVCYSHEKVIGPLQWPERQKKDAIDICDALIDELWALKSDYEILLHMKGLEGQGVTFANVTCDGVPLNARRKKSNYSHALYRYFDFELGVCVILETDKSAAVAPSC